MLLVVFFVFFYIHITNGLNYLLKRYLAISFEFCKIILWEGGVL